MPCVRPSSLSAVSRAAGESLCPSTPTASPRSNSTSIVCGLSGASSGLTVRWIHVVGGVLRRVFEHLALRGGVQQIGVHRERRVAALVLRHGDLVLLGEIEQRVAALELPFAPGRDHLDVRLQRVIGHLEAHLIVALARGAVTDGVGADFTGDLDLALGDQRPRDRRAEQIDALIDGVGPEHREDVVAHEFLAQILDIDLLDAHHLGLLARRLQLLALAEIGGEGHHLAAIGHLQPFQDDRGVEAAGIGEHDFLDVGHGEAFFVIGRVFIGGGDARPQGVCRGRQDGDFLRGLFGAATPVISA